MEAATRPGGFAGPRASEAEAEAPGRGSARGRCTAFSVIPCGGSVGIYLALLMKCVRVFVRRPFIACFYCLITPVMVLITYAVNEFYVDTSGGITSYSYDSCGKPLDVDFNYDFNPFVSLTLAAGPIITGILSTVFVQDESKSGLLIALLSSKRGYWAFWLSWWTLFTVLDLAIALVSAGLAKALPDVIFEHVSFGTIFATLFFGAGAIMLSIHFAVLVIAGFSRRSDYLILVYLLLVGINVVVTLSPLFGERVGPSYFQPENTTYIACESHIEGDSYTCGKDQTCNSTLIMYDGSEHTGCWYLASAQDSVWDTAGDPRASIQLAALFFIPSFHFAQIWAQIVGAVLLNGGTAYNAGSTFYDSTPVLIQKALGLDADPMYVRVESGTYSSARQCSLDEPAQVGEYGVVGHDAPSFGQSIGFLTLLAFVYLIIVLGIMYLRGHRVFRRAKLAHTNKRVLKAKNEASSTSTGSQRSKPEIVVDKDTEPRPDENAPAPEDEQQHGHEFASVDCPLNGGGECDKGLVIENVSLSFGKGSRKVKALDSVSIRVQQGRLLTILGKNGAGKSTLIQILCTYLVQDSGHIRCNGMPVTSVRLGICVQEDRLYREFTPTEHFALWARLRMVPSDLIPEIVDRWLHSLNLHNLRNYKVGALSGGACRRVSVGLATIGTPALVLLDEPTTGMDPINQRYVWRHIETMKKQSLVVLTTHSMAEADSLADEVVVLERGRVVASGPPLDLKLRYGSIAQLALYVRPEDVDFVVNRLDQDFAPLFQHHCIEVRTVSSGYLTVCIRRRSTELAPHSSGDSTTFRSQPGQDEIADMDEDLNESSNDEDPKAGKGHGISIRLTEGVTLAASDALRRDARVQTHDESARDSDTDTIIEDDDEVGEEHPHEVTVGATDGSLRSVTNAEQDDRNWSLGSGAPNPASFREAHAFSKDEEDIASPMIESARDEAMKDPQKQLVEGLAALITWVQSPESRIREYGISNTTFEEVFLSIVEDSNRHLGRGPLRSSDSSTLSGRLSTRIDTVSQNQGNHTQESNEKSRGKEIATYEKAAVSATDGAPPAKTFDRPAAVDRPVRQLARKTHSENMSIIFASEPRSQSTMSAPESSRRPSALSSKDVVPPSAGSAPPLQSVVQLRTLPAAADLQLQGLEVRAYGIWLWLEQVGAITFKNFQVRIFSWEVVAKWFVAVVLLVSITLVESTNSELRTDVLALSLLLSFVAILLIPYGVFEINSGYLQIFKLHRCTFATMAASELLFLFVVLFIIFIIAMSIFMAVTIGTGVHDEELLYLCNLDNASACRCVVVSNETDGVWVERELAILEEITTLVTDGTHDGVFWWYGRIVNEPGSWFMLLAVSVSLALGLSGLSLVISSLFRHHRMAAFFGGILLILWGVLPPILTLRHLKDSMFLPDANTCTVRNYVGLDISFENLAETTCAQRHLNPQQDKAAPDTSGDSLRALNLIFSIGFSSSMFNFFRGGTRTEVLNASTDFVGSSALAFSQTCSSDNAVFFRKDLGVFWAGSLVMILIGLFAYWLRTFPPEALMVLEHGCYGMWHRLCGRINPRYRSAPISEHRYSDDNLDDANSSWRGPGRTRSCVRAERERVESLVAAFDGLSRSERDPIALAKLSKTYFTRRGRVEALTDAYLAVRPGEVVGFLGPNGSAKSTLCRILNGTLSATFGKAYVMGLDVETQMTRILPHLGYVGQRDCLWTGLTARQHLELVLHLRGAMVTQQERVSLIEEVASRLDLSEFMDRKVSAMSGGMQRRLSIALAMLGSPRVVILDEPTTQLDPSTRRKVWECIQYFRESYKCAIVITTHSMEEADELCDRVCIITKGQIRAVDTPQGLKDRFGNGYVLILKVMPGHRQEALDFVKKHVYEQAVLGNCLNDVMRIYFPRDGFDLTHAFAELFSEKARTEGHIANFLLNQATLHDVFMNIAGLDEAHLEEIGYLNENAHELVVKLLRHRGFHASGVTPVQKASAPPSYPFR